MQKKSLTNYFTKEKVFDHTVLSHLATKMEVLENIDDLFDTKFLSELLLEDNFEDFSWKIFKINLMGEEFYHLSFMYSDIHGEFFNCIKAIHLEFTFLDIIEPVFEITKNRNELQNHINQVKELVSKES